MSDESVNIEIENQCDPIPGSWVTSGCSLRSYQADAMRNIFDAVVQGKGGRFAVTFPRQSGKNEMQAQLEAAVMAANQHRGGNIIKIIPTEKNQGKVSTERLAGVLRAARSGDSPFTGLSPSGAGESGDSIVKGQSLIKGQTPMNVGFRGDSPMKGQSPFKAMKDEIVYGNTRMRCLSASPNAAIVGATADLLLEVDEAQMVAPEKFDREAAPMAASTNAVQVFYGTAWDDQTLLSREMKLAQKEADKDGLKHVFVTTAAEVGKEVPQYETFVRSQIDLLGREHPAVRTQFFCEEITDLTSMFTPDRINKMKCAHEPLYAPQNGQCYVFLIDVAGSDEITPASNKANGFSDRRDATVVTICDVSLPEGKAYDPKNFVWKVVGRRLYRNLRAEMLEQRICQDIEQWGPKHIIIDHSGLGAMLSDVLVTKYKSRVTPIDITAANKTKMAWDFLAMVDTGRWQEHKGDEINVLKSSFKPGKEPYEILKEPELLQQMFYRELRGCRIEPTGNQSNVRWGVKDGTRDHATGRILHDDLVMSAALAVFETSTLPIRNHIEDLTEHYENLQKIYERRMRREMGPYWR